MRAEASELAAVAARVAGEDAVEIGTPGAAVGTVVPSILVAPRDAGRVAETLRWARGRRLAVVPSGAGTKLDWGAIPPRIDILLSTRRLDAVVAHRQGDLTATVQAGARLVEVNRILGRHRQWLPLDPACPDRATIGGIVATNDAGPRRHQHGAPRDLILGVRFVRSDGEMATAGGAVVKNVAGYDLARLLTGSFGALGVIIEATFKLAPVAPASRTLVASDLSAAEAAQAVSALTSNQLAPSALEVQGPPYAILARFETAPEAAERQVAVASALVRQGAASVRVLTGAAEAERWQAHRDAIWRPGGVVCRVGLRPADLAGFLDRFQALLEGLSVQGQAAGRARVGILHVRIEGEAAAVRQVVETVRQHVQSRDGHVVLLRAPADLRTAVDSWGSLGDAARVMAAVKREFDPEGILSPGRWTLERGQPD